MTRFLALGFALGLTLEVASVCALAGPEPGTDPGFQARALRIALFQWGEAPKEEEEPWTDDTPAPRGGSIMHEDAEEERVRVEGEPVCKISGGLSFPVLIPVAGYAGAGGGAPSYGDAFGPGFGLQLAGGYRVLPSIEGRVNFGFAQLLSSSFDTSASTGTVTNELSDYLVAWFTLGPRMYFLIDRPSEQWFFLEWTTPFKGFCPFAGFNLGLTFTGSVVWPKPPPTWDYWNAGVTTFFEIYGGAEYRVSNNFGAFAEAGLALLGPPNPASLTANSGMNEAGSLTALRLSVGVFLAI